MKNCKPIFVFAFICIALLFGRNGLYAVDETVIRVAGQSNFHYAKPEVKIAANDDIYIAYQAQDEGSDRSEIYLSRYSGGQVTFVANVSESSAYSYEPELEIGANGDIHVAWAEQNGQTHIVKYRYFNGSSWSGITTMGQVTETDNIEDLRLAVDNSGNAFIVFMHWPIARCKFISKYGNSVSFQDFPLSGRSKHPDVAVDNNNIHIVWQYKNSGEYTIAYQRRPNQAGSNWESWVDLDYYETQRPRMDLDGANAPHVVFFHDLGSERKLIYKKWNGSRFVDTTTVSEPNAFRRYHFCDISVSDSDNILVSMQFGGWSGGKNVSYNWKREGQWDGFATFSKSHDYKPTNQSIHLDQGRYFAAVAFANRNDEVYLLLAQESGSPSNEAPTARFTFSPQTGHAPLTTVFDASASSDPDGTISGYSWNFGDGAMGTGVNPSHTFQEGQYTITLTVTDNDGKSGTTSHDIVAEPPNVPPTAHFTFAPTFGLYPLVVNFDATGSSDPDGTIVQYEWNIASEQTKSGQTMTHTFTEKGVFKIILTVYDDDGDSATFSHTVDVWGLLSPLNTAYEILVNRNLFTLQYVARITWTKNPGNAARGSNITQYKIYGKTAGGVYNLIDTVAAQDGNEYYHRIGNERTEYQYAIVGVDDMGRESELPIATTSAGPQDTVIDISQLPGL
ncbi:MAG: PKD domain-containing protein [bacterium]|nr:PKD domain-containing protein [bacterium]